MKIGYPCINQSLDCTSSRTFRLASYSEERLIETVALNLACLQRILEYNVQNGLLFFRLTSDLVPFASHEINQYNWQEHFKSEFQQLGNYIKEHNLRISMHPDQFVVLNSPNPQTVKNSIAELVYQGTVLDLMELDTTAKLQIHGGGGYGDKGSALARFAEVYHTQLPDAVKARLCVENDDRTYSLLDCLHLHELTGIPIIFDNLHHECVNNGEPMREAVEMAASTWKPDRDGILMMDYSAQAPAERKGKHVQSISEQLFHDFLAETEGLDMDIMLEIKDKETSALKAVEVARALGRL
ncbi:UV DNA damage repair endonuclease UvsE [Pontibacter sp. BT310]|uniref:UV DNA damage repair endonuclease UvsE n=1 Tax=Pontibacter populi TaxID=890055 RepID=A0ABS6XGJ2_9BACT|nr:MULTISPECIES: UV DNA damage repair endonuclease UvsE [Pontibacter]MBJ6119436.1 UV DNA damage repair endonuclease UvsE [Pontibacter sp. BT310]MBR0571864.1 UV DNA damage repair endonuclease UvsE [Microvirga sp. STS03]MBW3366290.1 UV DNA damage repair endonuclease UvsE [Pontibacter populi]